MKIKIITIHAMHNPGSVLQAYALQEYLKNNYEVKIIDYRPNYFYDEGSKLKLALKKLLYGRAYKSRENKFRDFVKNNMQLTQLYKSYEELENSNLNADVFITGSDQLWNTDFPCGNDRAFYLKFVNCGKKISYSTSIGKKNIDEKNQKVLKENLMDFSNISVREKSTVDFLNNLLNKKVTWVCDPVFLLDKSKYTKFIDNRYSIEEKYVFVYLPPELKVLDMLIDEYKKRGYKIILGGGVLKRCECDNHIIDMGPEDFLSLIYYADIVISTSFHATAFCHIFHKEFFTILPTKNGERISSLLEQTELSTRGIKEDTKEYDIDGANINWETVDIKLREYINESKNYIDKALNK